MNIFVYVIGFIFGAMFFCGVYFLYRNNEVYKERESIYIKMNVLVDDDIKNGFPWKWRYEEFLKISYNKMLYDIFTPVKNFYIDNKCLKKSNIIHN